MSSIFDSIRIGTGYDVHRLVEGRDLILGGVKIPFPKGLLGHSDADVLIHAVVDALLGAASLGDIGALYPDTDEANKGIDSRKILRDVSSLLQRNNWEIVNIDSVIICQAPKILPFVSQMKEALADDLSVSVDRIGIKGKSTETLGFEGRGEGIAVNAAALLARKII